MEHGEHKAPGAKRFGVNTNGPGMLIVALVAVFLTLFCWSFWKDGSKEIEHYRLSPASEHAGGEHGHAEKPAEHGAAPMATPAEKHAATDTSHKAAGVDSTNTPSAESTKAHTSH